MQTSTWKKERDTLQNIYSTITETTHSPENSCKDDEYYCEKDKVCKKKAVEEDAITGTEPGDGMNGGGTEIGEPVDAIPGAEPDIQHEPDEVDAEIQSLKDLIMNPDPSRVEEYATSGRIGDYIDMLKKKHDAALAVKSVIRGDAD
jgi:hypothetical protein